MAYYNAQKTTLSWVFTNIKNTIAIPPSGVFGDEFRHYGMLIGIAKGDSTVPGFGNSGDVFGGTVIN